MYFIRKLTIQALLDFKLIKPSEMHDMFTQLNRDSRWLILGHKVLTKIKCTPLVIHCSA